MEFIRKANIICTVPWSHHHSGWPYCVCGLQKLHTNSILPEILDNERPTTKPWTGFLHATPSDSIKRCFDKKSCKETMQNCLGIFVLSNYLKKFLNESTNVKCHVVKHAIAPANITFNVDSLKEKKIVMIGHWMRRFESFSNLKCNGYEKMILRCTNRNHDAKIKVIDYLSPQKYEELLSNTIVFLDLEDSSANNTVIECIIRCTPILVNRLPALEEYLGKEYPLFYENIKEAESLMQERKLIEAYHYLEKLDKSDLTIENMIDSVYNSDIYKSIPIPIKIF